MDTLVDIQTDMTENVSSSQLRMRTVKNPSKMKFFCTWLLNCVNVFDNEGFAFTYCSVECRVDSFAYTVGDKNCGSVQSKSVQARLVRIKRIAMN